MMKDWLRKHPDVRTIRVAAADLNGQARGKRVPARFADKVVKDGTRFPFSVLNLDGVAVEKVGRELFEMILATASGEKTKSELHGVGEEEFAPWQIGPTL